VRVPAFRQRLVGQLQRANRRLNTAYLEVFYQTNYLDLARRTDWLHHVPLASPAGGTASFAQLYVLLTVLREARVRHILELGVDQSSVILDQYANETGAHAVHIDDDKRWLARAVQSGPQVTAIHAPLRRTTVGGRSIDWYECSPPPGRFDLVVVDGPLACTASTRFNRLGVLGWLPEALAPEHLIAVDDSNRRGERHLVRSLENRLPEDSGNRQQREITGANTLTVMATARFDSVLYL